MRSLSTWNPLTLGIASLTITTTSKLLFSASALHHSFSEGTVLRPIFLRWLLLLLLLLAVLLHIVAIMISETVFRSFAALPYKNAS